MNNAEMSNFTDCQKAVEHIERAIRHIQKSTDIDLRAKGIAIGAMKSQIDHIAEFGKKVERTAETAQNVRDGDRRKINDDKV